MAKGSWKYGNHRDDEWPVRASTIFMGAGNEAARKMPDKSFASPASILPSICAIP